MENKIVTNIIKFDDGTYFNGVKGKLVRTTKNFKDAKNMKKISDRDRVYLKNRKYKLLKVVFTIDILEEIVD